MIRDTVEETVRGTPWWLVLIEGVILAIVGILLFFMPGRTIAVLVAFLGIFWLVSGILALVHLCIDRTMWGWKLVCGILGIIAGFIVVRNPLWSALFLSVFLVVFLAVQAIITGAIEIYEAFSGNGWGIGILGAVNIILGIVLLFAPVIAALAVPFILGAVALVGGIITIIAAFKMRNQPRGTAMHGTMPV